MLAELNTLFPQPSQSKGALGSIVINLVNPVYIVVSRHQAKRGRLQYDQTSFHSPLSPPPPLALQSQSHCTTPLPPGEIILTKTGIISIRGKSCHPECIRCSKCGNEVSTRAVREYGIWDCRSESGFPDRTIWGGAQPVTAWRVWSPVYSNSTVLSRLRVKHMTSSDFKRVELDQLS